MRFLLHGFHPVLQSILIKELNPVLTVSDKKNADFSILEINKNPFKFEIANIDLIEYTSFYIYAKRYFTNFCDVYSRNFIVGNESFTNYENYFSQLCKLAISLLNNYKFDYVIFSNYPHEGFDWVLFKLVEFYKFNYVVIYDSVFPNKMFLTKNIKKLYDTKNINYLNHSLNIQKTEAEVKKPFYMKSSFRGGYIKQTIVLLKCYIKKPSIFIEDFIAFFHNFIYKIRYYYFSRKVDSLNEIKYVYFPLHMQPELTTTGFSNEFSDQLLCLEALRGILPVDVKIMVKENPKQGPFKRTSTFFKRINTLDNTYLISPKYPTTELINKSLFVATLNGTAAFEAIKSNKAALVFGDPWFSSLPGIFKYNSHTTNGLFELLITYKQSENINSVIEKFKYELFDGFVDIDYYENLDSKRTLEEAYRISADSILDFIKNYN
jgi:hypothetical protein